MVPDSGQGICRGAGRYVKLISPHGGHSQAATTLDNTGQNSRFSNRPTVDKQRKAGLRSRKNCVGIRSASGVTDHIHGGISLLERGLTH
jgi:hypothetical protein